MAFGVTSQANDSWLCTETASKRAGDVFLSCGIHEDTLESEARTGAYKAAQKEFEISCQSSADCRNRDYISTPLRNSCQKVNNSLYRCHRAIRFKILDKPKEHMTEYDSERIGEELQKTRQQYDEAKSLHEKQQELEELKRKIEDRDFNGDEQGHFEQPYLRKGLGGVGFVQFTNIQGVDSDYLTFPFSAEYYDGRWAEEYVFIVGTSEEILAWSLQILARYYFTYRFSVGIGGALNYVDFSAFTGNFGFEEEAASVADVSAVLKVSYLISRVVSVDFSYSLPIFSKATTFKGVEVKSLNRLGFGLSLHFPF